jgi:hypothetical protein
MEDRLKTPRRRLAPTVVLTCLVATLAGSAIGMEPDETNRAAPGLWSSDLLQDSANWPHSEQDSRIVGTPAGLRVEVAAERRFAIAAMPGLGLRKDLGQIRVRVVEMGGGAS